MLKSSRPLYTSSPPLHLSSHLAFSSKVDTAPLCYDKRNSDYCKVVLNMSTNSTAGLISLSRMGYTCWEKVTGYLASDTFEGVAEERCKKAMCDMKRNATENEKKRLQFTSVMVGLSLL